MFLIGILLLYDNAWLSGIQLDKTSKSFLIIDAALDVRYVRYWLCSQWLLWSLIVLARQEGLLRKYVTFIIRVALKFFLIGEETLKPK